MAGPDHAEFERQDDNKVFAMRRSLLTCIRFASMVLLWTGVLQNLVIGQENYPGYDFGSSPSRAQSLWSGEPRIGKISNETPKSPMGQLSLIHI